MSKTETSPEVSEVLVSDLHPASQRIPSDSQNAIFILQNMPNNDAKESFQSTW
jgi:hypothetical protein